MSKEKKYWMCIIGPTYDSNLAKGADLPMRKAVQKAFFKTSGHQEMHTFSGWGNSQKKVDVINAVWSMDEKDPIYIAIENILKASGRLE